MGIEQFIKSVCVQTAVYWGNPQDDGYGGLTFDEPVEIKCRWDKVDSLDIAALMTVSAGESILAQADILVTQDLDIKGFLYLGRLTDIDPTLLNNPKELAGAAQIVKFSKTSMIKSTTQFVRKASV